MASCIGIIVFSVLAFYEGSVHHWMWCGLDVGMCIVNVVNYAKAK